MLALLVMCWWYSPASPRTWPNAFNTVQAYGARFASVERELGSVKTLADQLKTDSDAVGGRLKRMEDDLARFRR